MLASHLAAGRLAALSLAGFTLFQALPASACSSCGCNLGTEWADEGYSASPGLRLDLRYDFINQNQLRNGRHAASAQDVQAALAAGTVAETQQRTRTRFYTLGLDYAFNRDWGVNLQAPLLDRDHATLADGESVNDASHKRGLGDVRVVARYQGLFADRSLGVQVGVKLPTGDHRQNFSSGPDAGAPLDRGLQLGTGTTDLIVGLYHYSAFDRDWDHFEQAQYKNALNARDGFRPGPQFTANAGVRYVGYGRVIPQLQVNLKIEDRESGDPAVADIANSGSREIDLSPGLTVKPSKNLALYGFVQVPVYRAFNGLQLAPRYILSSGLRYGF